MVELYKKIARIRYPNMVHETTSGDKTLPLTITLSGKCGTCELEYRETTYTDIEGYTHIPWPTTIKCRVCNFSRTTGFGTEIKLTMKKEDDPELTELLQLKVYKNKIKELEDTFMENLSKIFMVIRDCGLTPEDGFLFYKNLIERVMKNQGIMDRLKEGVIEPVGRYYLDEKDNRKVIREIQDELDSIDEHVRNNAERECAKIFFNKEDETK